MQEQEIQPNISQNPSFHFQNDFPRIQSLFTMKKQGFPQQKVIGKMYSHYLMLQKIQIKQITRGSLNYEPSNFKIQFDFDTIFSILRNSQTQYQEQTCTGHPYAIQIQKYGNTVELYSDKPEQIEIWARKLQQKLNQKNFHKKFKPIKKIGKGNFASVYLVHKYADEKQYAVKAFSKEIQYSQQRGKEALQNQINIMRELDNKYLMKIQGVYETENSLYMCVQYLSGGILFDKIKERRRFTHQQIKQIMKCLLEGTAAMHEKNIMHRDLKPQNIIFRDSESLQCVIADFGLATKADANNYIFTRCGTPGYVAPQISNLKNQTHYSPVCDIFSLGVIFHILLTGKSPFPGTQCNQVLKQNRECNIDFNSDLYKRLNPITQSLLRQMLAKNPEQRISAKNCLNHQFFRQSAQILPLQQFYTHSTSSSKKSECESPLMTSKNPKRKRNLKLKDDSCLKFKMKEQFQMNQQDVGDKIHSPAHITKKITRGRHDKKCKTLYPPSNFKE